MSGNIQKKYLKPYSVWAIFMILTAVYGTILALISGHNIFEGLWTIFTSRALLPTDYITLTGSPGIALINSALAGLLALIIFKLAKLEISGLQMGAFGLIMGFALFGKNPVNMLPIFIGAYVYSLYKKRPYKEHVTLSAFSTCLAPVVSQPAHVSQFVNMFGMVGAVAFGAFLGICIGFFINSMGVFIKKSHEGLNLYNVGWGAGLLSIALTMIYNTLGIDQGYFVGAGAHPAAAYNNIVLGSYLAGTAVFFLIVGFLAKPSLNIPAILNMKADDNDFFKKHGAGDTYVAMGLLSILAIILMAVFRVNYGGAVLGSIISMVGWGGFGKSFANSFAIISGVILGGLARFLIIGDAAVFAMSHVSIWTSAFWGTCLSPMAKFFGWKWALAIGFLHFTFAFSIAPFHWGQNLYNNGLAAGFVCVVMIPVIRAFDKKGKYNPKTS